MEPVPRNCAADCLVEMRELSHPLPSGTAREMVNEIDPRHGKNRLRAREGCGNIGHWQ
jgi:hypothetical protein